jgi:hypothetical protein
MAGSGVLLAEAGLFFSVAHPVADDQADDEGADDNDQDGDGLHGVPLLVAIALLSIKKCMSF